MTSTLPTVLKSLEGIWKQFLEHLPFLVAGVAVLIITGGHPEESGSLRYGQARSSRPDFCSGVRQFQHQL